jgi:hypothetical protein
MSRLTILAACLALAGCRATHSGIDPAMEAFIPPDTLALAGVRMDQLRATPLYRRLAERNRLPRIDDVSELLLAHDGKNSLVIARGAFRGKAHPDGFFTFVSDTIALAGHAPSHGGVPPALLARIQTLPRDRQIWAVSSGWSGFPPEVANEMGNAANLNRVLRSVSGASLTASFESGVHAAATGDCRTGQEAASLAENLRGLVALGRLSVPKSQADLLRVYDGIQVRQDGRAVKLTIDIPADLAERFVDLWR